LHSTSNITSKTRLTGTEALTGIEEIHTLFWWENMKEKSRLADLGIDTCQRNRTGENKPDSSGSEKRQVDGSLNRIMNLWVPNNVGNFLNR
jgi:hypothetical protein